MEVKIPPLTSSVKSCENETSAGGTVDLPPGAAALVLLGDGELALLLETLALERLALLVADGRWLFEVLAALPLADDAFPLHHPLEALERFLEQLVFSDDYVCDELFLL